MFSSLKQSSFMHSVGTPLVVGLAYHGSTEKRKEGLENLFGKHIDAAAFERHLQIIVKEFQPLSLTDIARSIREKKTLPRKGVFLTFDDAYAGNYEVAFPLLKKYGVPATFFVPTDFIETGKRMPLDILDAALKYSDQGSFTFPRAGEKLSIENNEQKYEAALKVRKVFKMLSFDNQAEFVKAVAEALGFTSADEVPDLGEHTAFCSWKQLREMADGGMEIGSHTHRHVILAKAGDEIRKDEVSFSKKILEEKLQKPCEHFCYVNGRYPDDGNFATNVLVKEAGYHSACYMMGGVNSNQTNPYQLNRNAVGLHTLTPHLKEILGVFSARIKSWMGS